MDLKWSRSNASTLTGAELGFVAGHQNAAGLEKSAAVEQPGQRIGFRRRLVAVHGAVLGQDQHDEGGADHIEHDLDREYCDPSGRRGLRTPRLASATGNRKMAPCSIGTNTAGQRRIRDLRRSRHNSAATRNV